MPHAQARPQLTASDESGTAPDTPRCARTVPPGSITRRFCERCELSFPSLLLFEPPPEADGRGLRDHRPLQITRQVMGNQRSEDETYAKVSCAVKLGHTHILCTLVKSRSDRIVLQCGKPHVTLSLTLIKDSSLNLRRDLVEEKEA